MYIDIENTKQTKKFAGNKKSRSLQNTKIRFVFKLILGIFSGDSNETLISSAGFHGTTKQRADINSSK